MVGGELGVWSGGAARQALWSFSFFELIFNWSIVDLQCCVSESVIDRFWIVGAQSYPTL